MRKLELAKAYLGEQVQIFKEKSLKSIKKAQQFAIKYDLTPLQEKEFGDDEIINDLDIEIKRVGAANAIRNIDENLTQIEKLIKNNDQDTLIYLSKNLIMATEPNLIRKYEIIESNLLDKKFKYTDKDKELSFLKKKKKIWKN